MMLNPANDNSQMVPLWVCIRQLADAAQRARDGRVRQERAR